MSVYVDGKGIAETGDLAKYNAAVCGTVRHGQMCLVELDQRRDKNDREHDGWDHKEGHPWIQKGLGMLGDVWVCLGCFETGIETRKAPSTRSGSVPEKLEKPAIFAHHTHVTTCYGSALFKPQWPTCSLHVKRHVQLEVTDRIRWSRLWVHGTWCVCWQRWGPAFDQSCSWWPVRQKVKGPDNPTC